MTTPAKAPWEVEAAIEKLLERFPGCDPSVSIETSYYVIRGELLSRSLVTVSARVGGQFIVVAKHAPLNDVLEQLVKESEQVRIKFMRENRPQPVAAMPVCF